MKAAFLQSTDFTYLAEVRQLDRIENRYNVKITSTWGKAKDPVAEHVHFQFTGRKEDLLALASTIIKEVEHGS